MGIQEMLELGWRIEAYINDHPNSYTKLKLQDIQELRDHDWPSLATDIKFGKYEICHMAPSPISFGVVASKQQKAAHRLYNALSLLALIGPIVLVIFISRWWLLLLILLPLFRGAAKAAYNDAIFGSALCSEQGFCFLFSRGTICLRGESKLIFTKSDDSELRPAKAKPAAKPLTVADDHSTDESERKNETFWIGMKLMKVVEHVQKDFLARMRSKSRQAELPPLISDIVDPELWSWLAGYSLVFIVINNEIETSDKDKLIAGLKTGLTGRLRLLTDKNSKSRFGNLDKIEPTASLTFSSMRSSMLKNDVERLEKACLKSIEETMSSNERHQTFPNIHIYKILNPAFGGRKDMPDVEVFQNFHPVYSELSGLARALVKEAVSSGINS